MGTKFAPNYANLFMGEFETKFLDSQVLKPLCWWRFIDDLFMLWAHSYDTLQTFISNLNAFHPKINFTVEMSLETVNFLDVTIRRVGNRFETTLYRKPTDYAQYLDFYSEHPAHCKKSLPRSVALRCKRICSDTSDLETNLTLVRKQFIDRRYPPELVQNAINSIRSDSSAARRHTAETNQIRFVTTYHSNSANVASIIR
jgi:hypothetical protein